MNRFNELLDVADRLLGPGGCPWDREQTLATLQPYLLEETHELIEAIDLKDSKKMKEELGDLFYTLIFLAKVAEKEGLFNLEESFQSIIEKLIRRHPHIFSDTKVDSKEEVMENWEEIKRQEGHKNPIAGIPPSLPALARAQKVIQKLVRAKKLRIEETSIESEEELGKALWDLVKQGEQLGFDAERALRCASMAHEKNWV